jgi:V/A-type H+-transporting ATPase subunit K
MAMSLAAALAAGLGCLGASYAVARVGSAALGAAAERPELLMRSLIFVALGEGIAIFGLLIAILLVLKLPK